VTARARPPVIQLPDTLCGTPTAAGGAGASPDVTQQLMLAQVWGSVKYMQVDRHLPAPPFCSEPWCTAAGDLS
jgi:hypothetical protein